MTTTHTQPAGCDLDSLEALARAADQGEGQHIYTNPRDSNNWKANEEWHQAASPAAILPLIAAARAAQAPQGDTRQGDAVVEPSPPTRGTGVARDADGNYFSQGDVMRIADGIRPGDGWSGEDWDYVLANAVANELARRLRAQGGNTSVESTDAAHTCTPADERTEQIRLAYADPTGRSKAQMVRDVECLLAHIALLRAPARAAQGAGTAPVEERMRCEDCDGRGHDGEPVWQGHFQPPEPSVCNSCSGTGWWSVPAPVSTAAAPTCKPAQAAPPLAQQFATLAADAQAKFEAEQNPHMARILVGMRDAFHIAEKRARAAPVAAPEAPATEQHAATTASASIDANGRFTFPVDDRTPSRAADGQQDASCAALDKDTIRSVFMRHGFTVKEGQTDLKDYVYAAADELVTLARAPLPAQATIQPTLMRQAVASVVSRSGDDLRIGWLRPERCDVGTLLYCAVEPSRAQSDTTGDHNAS